MPPKRNKQSNKHKPATRLTDNVSDKRRRPLEPRASFTARASNSGTQINMASRFDVSGTQPSLFDDSDAGSTSSHTEFPLSQYHMRQTNGNNNVDPSQSPRSESSTPSQSPVKNKKSTVSDATIGNIALVAIIDRTTKAAEKSAKTIDSLASTLTNMSSIMSQMQDTNLQILKLLQKSNTPSSNAATSQNKVPNVGLPHTNSNTSQQNQPNVGLPHHSTNLNMSPANQNTGQATTATNSNPPAATSAYSNAGLPHSQQQLPTVGQQPSGALLNNNQNMNTQNTSSAQNAGQPLSGMNGTNANVSVSGTPVSGIPQSVGNTNGVTVVNAVGGIPRVASTGSNSNVMLGNQAGSNTPNVVGNANMSMKDLLEKVGLPGATVPGTVDTGFEADMSASQILADILKDSKPRKVVSAGLNLGDNLPQKIKDDIWVDRYVDLAEIYFARDTPSYSLSMDGVQVTENSTVHLQAVKKQRQIKNITQWSKAWDTYVAVYVKKPSFLRHINDLYTYSHQVKSMAEQGYNWIYYDHEFRKDRAAMDNPYPWNAYREDLYLQAASVVFRQQSNLTGQQQALNQNNNKVNGQSGQAQASVRELIPKGYCYSFHSPQQRCSKNNECKYSHDCFKCKKARHPTFKCKAQGSGKSKADKSKPKGDETHNTD